MTTQEMIDLVDKFLSADLDSYHGDAPSDADKVAVLNWAQRTVSKRISHFSLSLALTLVAGQGEYSLRTDVSKRVIRPYRVTVGGNLLCDASGRGYGVWTFAELERYRPGWRTLDPGTPVAAVHVTQNLILSAPPSADVVAQGGHYVAGTHFAADLSAANLAGVSELPEEAHEAICYLAAQRHALPSVTEDFAWNRISQYASHVVTVVDELAQENRNSLNDWGSTPSADLDYMYV